MVMMYLPTLARLSKDAKLAVKPDKITQAILKLNWVPFCPIAGTASFKIHSNMKLYNKLNGGKRFLQFQYLELFRNNVHIYSFINLIE